MMMRLLPLPLLACLLLAATACASPVPLQRPIPDDLQTPVGNELDVACPLQSGELPPGTLCSLLPPDPVSGQALKACIPWPNSSLGDPFSGSFASEGQLDQMGRRCGGWVPGLRNEPYDLSTRIDLYASSSGAAEAFRREAASLADNSASVKSDESGLSAIGDERSLLLAAPIYLDGEDMHVDEYYLLFRRRNIVAQLYLQYGQQGSPQPAVQYAAQLDRNIEAAAQ